MMKKIVFIVFFLLFLIGCGGSANLSRTNEPQPQHCTVVSGEAGEFKIDQSLVCPDGSTFDLVSIVGPAGIDGSDCTVSQEKNGALVECDDGTNVFIPNGSDAVKLSTAILPKHTCSQLLPGIFAQNINFGEVFDVYTTSSCNDFDKTEICDNVETQFGATNNPPSGNEYPGSAKVCWAGNIQLSGTRQRNGDILVHILDFN